MIRMGLLACLLIIPTATHAQPPDTVWTSTFGGAHTDLSASVLQTPDGSFVFAGSTDSNGTTSLDAWLVKVDSAGDLVWSTVFGGSGDEAAYSVQTTSDGGFIMAGYTTSYGSGGYDSWLVKTDADGAYQWDATFGGAGLDLGYTATQLSDGGYALVGYTASSGAGGYDIHLVRTDDSGELIWEEFYGGSQDDIAYSFAQTADGGYVITGYTSSQGPGPYNLWLLKTDSTGTVEWDKVLGGSEGEIGYEVRQTTNGGYIITGYTSTWGAGSSDLWLVRTDNAGTVIWDSYFGGTQWDVGMSVTETWDGGFAVTGYTDTDGPATAIGYDLWILKTDSAGIEEWEIILDNGNDSYGQALAQTSDNGYVVTGYTWMEASGADDFDVWLIRLDAETGIGGGANPPSAGPVIESVFPNPSAGTFSIQCTPGESGELDAAVYGITGLLVTVLTPDQLLSPTVRFTWNGRNAAGNDVPDGIYLLRVSDGYRTVTARMVLIR